MPLCKAGRGSHPSRIALEAQNTTWEDEKSATYTGTSWWTFPFPKKVRNELVTAGRAEPHHILPDSGWISIFLRGASDVDRAIELLHLSFVIASQRTTK
jgi:Family of unknown function (DUF5519)